MPAAIVEFLSAPGSEHVIKFLGKPSGRISAVASYFRCAYSLESVRRHLLSEQLWLLADCGDDSPLAVRCQDGLWLPWHSSVSKIDSVLPLPVFGLVVLADSDVKGTTLRCWEVSGKCLWEQRLGMKLLPQLQVVESTAAIIGGAFEGLFAWSIHTGELLWQEASSMPIDQLWSAPWREVVFATGSEVLGLETVLSAWSVGKSHKLMWSKSGQDMFMALVADEEDRVFVRRGCQVVAYRLDTGECLWELFRKDCPILPTQPTILRYVPQPQDTLFMAVGRSLWAWNATTAEFRFQVGNDSFPWRQLMFVPDLNKLVAYQQQCSEGPEPDGSLFLVVDTVSGRETARWVAKVGATCMLIHAQVGLLTAGGKRRHRCSETRGVIELRHLPSNKVAWRLSRAGSVTSLVLCNGIAYAGGWGMVTAILVDRGSFLWHQELPAIAASLALVCPKSSFAAMTQPASSGAYDRAAAS